MLHQRARRLGLRAFQVVGPGDLSDDARQRMVRLDRPGYVDLALRGGPPEAVLHFEGRGRDPWLTSNLDQVFTRDAVEPSSRDPVRLARIRRGTGIELGRDRGRCDDLRVGRRRPEDSRGL